LETVFFPVGPSNSNLQSDILEIVPAADAGKHGKAEPEFSRPELHTRAHLKTISA
jgi:hypothetical protein